MKPGSIILYLMACALPLMAQDSRDLASEADLMWLVVAGVLVFFMQAGFAFVEAGFTRSKNTVNILMKNLMDFAVGSLVFLIIGFSLMFGPALLKGIGIGMPDIGSSSLLLKDGKPSAYAFAFLFFQTVFAGTAATIASGAMAERTKFYSYMVYSAVVTAVIYPVFGSFTWSNLWDADNPGFLASMGFIDFAGSTVVHSVGAWVGLAGTLVLGPRIGRYLPDGTVMPIFGHNMSMATLGLFILWFGWFGFNPGSTGTLKDGNFAIIAVTTNLAAAAGAVSAMITSWIKFRHPDISMAINGALAGLVGITAGCANVSPAGAIAIGLVCGVAVIASVLLLDKLHIDDPVGAVSVHGVCGAIGTIAIGLIADPAYGGTSGLFFGGGWELLRIQTLGVVVAFGWSLGAGLILFWILRATIGLRVSPEEEIEGLDVLEHGNEAYPEQS